MQACLHYLNILSIDLVKSVQKQILESAVRQMELDKATYQNICVDKVQVE
jgi:hypothetical protein